MSTLRAYLAAQSDLTDLTGSRIWAALTYPPAGYNPSDGPAIVFNSRGGPGLSYNSQMLTDSIQFKCYAADQLAALTLYGVLVDVLHDASALNIRNAALEVSGAVLQEPEPVGWPFVLCFFTVIFDSSLGV